MMRSMAACMKVSGWTSDDEGFGFELGDRLVGEADLVEFAALKHRDDDLEQPLVGGKAVRDGAGLAQIVRGDGIGVAHHLDIHHLHSALDQHGLWLSVSGLIMRRSGRSSYLGYRCLGSQKPKSTQIEACFISER